MKKEIFPLLITMFGFIGFVCSCTTYRSTSPRFPLTVLKGSADITFTFIPLKMKKALRNAAGDDELLKVSAQHSKENADTHRRIEKQTPLPRSSPSENDYQSNIRYRTRPSPHTAGAGLRDGYVLYNPYKECVSAEQFFSVKIPRGCYAAVSITNVQSEVLEFICSGRLFRLEHGENTILEFRY